MNNTQRSLKNVVSIDGWIGAFGDDGRASVHVDVVFSEGRFGGEPSHKVKFRVSLKKAEVMVRIPEGEPLVFVKSSLVRTPPGPTLARETKKSKTLNAGAKAGISISPKAFDGSLSAEAGAAVTTQTTDTLQTEIMEFLCQHFPEEGDFGWRLQHRDFGSSLQGSPWDANAAPRVLVERSTKLNTMGDAPTIKVEVRCLREDLHIEGLEAIDPSYAEQLRNMIIGDVNRAAAEQIIKEELVRSGFLGVPDDVGNGYVQIVVADVIISEEMKR